MLARITKTASTYIHKLFLLGILMLVVGCASGSRAQFIDPPIAAIDADAQNAAEDPLFVSAIWVPDEWWKLFYDAQLTNFIEVAFVRNPTLQIARANILQAAAIADRARSVLFPQLLLAGDISRQKFSETGIIPFNSTQPIGTRGQIGPAGPMPAQAQIAATGGKLGIPVYFTQYETEFNLTFDFDIWGKNRKTWAAALSEVQANIADEAFSRLQLAIAVSRAYFNLQVDYKRQSIAKKMVANRESYFSLVKKRLVSNLADAINLNIAETHLSSARQYLLQIQGEIAVHEHELKAYLAGNFEEEIQYSGIVEQPLPKVPLPSEIPLNLISHRPDIAAQLWTIQSAGLQIEVAKAGFYPDFNLIALAGFQTIHLSELFRGKSTYFNVDPAFSLPIFEGGRLVANLRASEVDYDQAIFEYNRLILEAAREVLDGIAVLRNANQQWIEYKNQTDSQVELNKLTELRVKHHLNSALDALDSEENALNAEDLEVIALGNTIQAILSLIKALGGGYNAACET